MTILKNTHKEYHKVRIKRNSLSKKQILMKSTSEKESISEMPHKLNSIPTKNSFRKTHFREKSISRMPFE